MDEKDEQAFKVACDALYAWGYSEQFSRSLWITALEYARNKQAEPVAWRYCVAVAHRMGKGYVNRIKTSKLVCTVREAEVIQKDWQSWTRTGVFTVEIFPVYTHPAPAVAQPPVCQTCNGNGRIGGPSYYAPDEGGVPCPDCNHPPADVVRELVEALDIAVCQNSHDMVMTGEELRRCEAALKSAKEHGL